MFHFMSWYGRMPCKTCKYEWQWCFNISTHITSAKIVFLLYRSMSDAYLLLISNSFCIINQLMYFFFMRKQSPLHKTSIRIKQLCTQFQFKAIRWYKHDDFTFKHRYHSQFKTQCLHYFTTTILMYKLEIWLILQYCIYYSGTRINSE